MAGDNSSDGFPRKRPVLGDLTNQVEKRGLLMISGNLGSKSGDGNGKYGENKEGHSHFTQKVCQDVENMVKEKSEIRPAVNDNDKHKRACVSPWACSRTNSLEGNIISGISRIPNKVEELNTLGSSLHLGRSDVFGHVEKIADTLGGSCFSGISMPMASESCVGVEGSHDKDKEIDATEVAQSDPLGEGLVAHVCKKHSKDICADGLTSGKCGSTDCSRLPKPQGSASFKLEKCMGLKDNGSSYSSGSVDLIKSCSCSFCMKAAYIWSDLHYQDVRGRIAALKKSQKEASIMVDRSCKDKGIDKRGQGNCYKFSKLESDLTSQWRSLFLHMEDIFVREGSQLEASLLALKDLRERRKIELEKMNGIPLEKQ
ncbi:uncharacterized protein LOC127804778 [Diospyros lotus]|uniref:uncharacterized protein LOC127804778 n=1 Tax=Diospyros lotus TaxID=55363 RepID=UPI002253DFA9|nr:uncharacterized protein LOC127804778 [Diospyros lotus]